MEKNDKKLRDKLIMMIYSDRWTPEMEFTYLMSMKFKCDFLWLRPIGKKSTPLSNKSKHRTNHSRNNFKIETKLVNDHYSSPVMFDMLSNSVEKNSWIFRLDNDEIISEKSLQIAINSLPYLDKSVAYGIPRLWINKFGKSWFYSGIAATHGCKYDINYRLFTLSNAGPITGVHSGGLKFNKTRKFKNDCFILHLIYLNENLEMRCKKVANYETFATGSGHSKMRHYLPELYPKSIWKPLSNSETKLIKLFKNFN